MGHGSVWELGPAAEKVARKCLRLLDSKLGDGMLVDDGGCRLRDTQSTAQHT